MKLLNFNKSSGLTILHQIQPDFKSGRAKSYTNCFPLISCVGFAIPHLPIFLFLPIFTFSCQPSTTQESSTPPNILLVVADDMGRELGCYGDQQAQTPHLDRFASQYTQYNNAYVTTASCSPSRSSIFTGLYPHQNGQIGLSHRGFSMYQDFLTIPAALKESGYATGVIGKIHVKPLDILPFDWRYGGFDYEYRGERDPYHPEPVEKVTEEWETITEKAKFTRLAHLVADSAALFIDRNRESPFFLMVNLLDPHAPFYQQVAGEPADPVHGESLENLEFTGWTGNNRKERLAAYYNGCTRVDVAFNQLLERLKARGLYENTLVIFMGDHGAPLSRAKLTNFEAGVAIPMLVKYPQQEAHQTIDQYVSTIDLLPTMMDLNGMNVPENLPGLSWLKIDDQDQEWRDAIFTEFDWHTRDIFFPRRAIRQENYKLIANPIAKVYADFKDQIPIDSRLNGYAENPEYELYDLEKDPHEFNNRVNDRGYQAIGQRLITRLKEWQQKTNDPLLNQDSLAVYRNQVKELVEINSAQAMSKIRIP